MQQGRALAAALHLLALAATAVALPLSVIHAARVVWPGRGAPRE